MAQISASSVVASLHSDQIFWLSFTGYGNAVPDEVHPRVFPLFIFFFISRSSLRSSPERVLVGRTTTLTHLTNGEWTRFQDCPEASFLQRFSKSTLLSLIIHIIPHSIDVKITLFSGNWKKSSVIPPYIPRKKVLEHLLKCFEKKRRLVQISIWW